MFKQQFYHRTLRNYIVMFGNLFNNICVHRYDSDNNINTSIKVPINYGPREKALSRLDQDPDLIHEYAMILPRLSFEMIAMNYAPDRKTNTLNRRAHTTNSDESRLQYQYAPVPYDLQISLSVMVKNADDGAQILEQILPYFTPEWTQTLQLIPDMNFVTDIPVVLQAVSTEDTYEGAYEQRRAMIHTLDFILKGYFFGPIKTGEIIKTTQIDIGVPKANTEVLIDAKTGQPLINNKITDADVAATGRSSRITTKPVSDGVSLADIDAADNFGFGIDRNFYTDGLKYNPVTDQDE